MENGPFIDDELEKWPIDRGKINENHLFLWH